ncbi:sulfurtransferase [Fictibacillus phosphorivorans]|uniref:sulfurtransferase n=1 Tax=Fictibacillus phosphorivorans TaxID=1221500 RepID=UPI001293471C|nr:sulfurtransferase [Fictibacillus phosphorivorans]MQR96380.1 sulfurtransferase [Fictibacillus phosphorivorans]
MSNFVSPEWVNQKVNSADIVIFDCRFSLAEPSKGYELYKNDHIEGAIYADLNQHLSSTVSTHGGRHPLPSVNILSQFFSRCGVDQEKIVVAYDDQSGSMAARLWWILKYLGHDTVYVMQGGYTHYKEKGYVISSKMPIEKPAHFTPKVRDDMLKNKDDVLCEMKNDGTLIVDAREFQRYIGKIEPIDHKAGHIPNAINIPWESHLQEPGWWKSRQDLQSMYNGMDEKKPVIVYCGSGVTACVNILAMDEAGIANKALYAGSWSDWISYVENPIIKETT